MADSQSFKDALDDMWALHQLKNKDYGAQGDPYRNVRSGADWGVDPWVSALIRGSDKLKRLQKYAQTKELANEGAEDSLIDLAVYSVIALVLWREQYHEKREQKTFTPVSDINATQPLRTFVPYAEDVNTEPGGVTYIGPKSEGC